MPTGRKRERNGAACVAATGSSTTTGLAVARVVPKWERARGCWFVIPGRGPRRPRYRRVPKRRRGWDSCSGRWRRFGSGGGEGLSSSNIAAPQDHIAADLEQLFRRVAFNVAVGNRDDHLRNHGMILTSRGWRLAPAFDFNPNTDEFAASRSVARPGRGRQLQATAGVPARSLRGMGQGAGPEGLSGNMRF